MGSRAVRVVLLCAIAALGGVAVLTIVLMVRHTPEGGVLTGERLHAASPAPGSTGAEQDDSIPAIRTSAPASPGEQRDRGSAGKAHLAGDDAGAAGVKTPVLVELHGRVLVEETKDPVRGARIEAAPWRPDPPAFLGEVSGGLAPGGEAPGGTAGGGEAPGGTARSGGDASAGATHEAGTDWRGVFRLRVASGTSWGIRVEHPDFASWRGGPFLPGDDVRVQLHAAHEVTVRVLDPEGVAVVGCTVGAVPLRDAGPSIRPTAIVARVTTGEDGRATLRGLPRDAYVLTASHPSFLPYRGTQVVEVPLESGRAAETIRLDAGLRLAGRVIDAATAAGIGNARVAAHFSSTSIETSTGADGSYAIGRPVDPGASLAVSAPGYATTWFDVVQLLPGATTTADGVRAVDLRLEGRGVSAEGRVMGASGAGLEDIPIRVSRGLSPLPWIQLWKGISGIAALDHPWAWRVAARSDASGGFVLEDLEPGKDHAILAGDARVGLAVAWVLATPPGEHIELGDLVLRALGSARGRVIDLDGHALPGVRVEAHPDLVMRGGEVGRWRPRRLWQIVATRASVSGRFELAPLDPGGYQLFAAGQPAGSIDIVAGERRGSLVLRVGSGKGIEAAGASSAGKVRLEVRVSDLAGEPLEGIWVTAVEAKDRAVSPPLDRRLPLDRALSDADGRAVLSVSSGGLVELWPWDPRGAYQGDPSTLRMDRAVPAESDSATSRTAAIASVELRLGPHPGPLPELSGRVTDAAGAAAAGIQVVCEDASSDHPLVPMASLAITKEDGTFRLTVPEGVYRLNLLDPRGRLAPAVVEEVHPGSPVSVMMAPWGR